MAWVSTKDRLPPTGSEVNCQLRHWNTKGVIENRLKKVDEGDCSWRVIPGNDEVSYNWDVIQWDDESIQSPAETAE